MKISVLIPVRNAGPFLAETIRSVLSQSVAVAEIHVVDDGSTDDTAAVAESFGAAVTLHRQGPLGPAAARNVLLRSATGDLVTFLDADDLFPADRLERQLAALRYDVDGVGGRVVEFLDPISTRDLPAKPRLKPLSQPMIAVATLLLRRQKALEVGPFDERFLLGDIVDWIARARDAGLRLLAIDHVVMARRIHGRNLGIERRDSRPQYAEALHGVLARRRRAVGAGDGKT